MSDGVEFLEQDDILDGPKHSPKSPFGEKDSLSVSFILKTGLVKNKNVAAGIVVGSSIFFISLSIVISINVIFSPTSSYIRNRFPVIPIETTVDQVNFNQQT